MVLLMLLAALWGVVQLGVLASPARSLRMGTVLLAVAVGCYFCGTSALVVEHAWTRAYAAWTGEPLVLVVQRASYTVDPVIEEVAKLLPLVAVVALGRQRRSEPGITDLLILGGALGAGFAFLEATLQLGWRASRAVPVDGGYTIGMSILSGVHVPGISDVLHGWVPALFTDTDLLGRGDARTVDIHLAWTALTAFGLGLLVRVRGRRRWLGVLPVVYACVDHAAYNADLRSGGRPGLVVGLLGGLHQALWLWPLLALVAAVVLDRRSLAAAARRDPALRVAGEGPGVRGASSLLRVARLDPPWSSLVAWRFVLLRRSALYATARRTGRTATARDAGVELTRTLDQARDGAAWRAARRRLRPRLGLGRPAVRHWRLWVWLVLLAPVLLYYVVGAVPVFSAVQGWLARPGATAVVVVIVAAGVLWTAWRTVVLVRLLRARRREPWSEPLVRTGARLLVALGSMVMAAALVALWVGGVRDGAAHLVPASHVLEALGRTIMLAALVLLLLSVVMFPPLALLAVEGAGAVIVVTASAELAAAVGGAIALGYGGYLLTEAADGSSSSGSSGSGTRPRTREERLDELASDPARGGQITATGLREAEVGLEMEEAGALRGPVQRSPHAGTDLVDGNGMQWDVKSYRSAQTGRGRFVAEDALRKLRLEVAGKDGVIIDTKLMSAEDVHSLRALVERAGLGERVKWW